MTMGMRDVCPQCGSQQFKKNGHIHNGKQNQQCTGVVAHSSWTPPFESELKWGLRRREKSKGIATL